MIIAVVAARHYSADNHTNFTYNMHIFGTPRRKIGLSLKPDINDPNFYCRVCKTTYQWKSSYRQHVKHKHQVD
jgi:hypothetical protein